MGGVWPFSDAIPGEGVRDISWYLSFISRCCGTGEVARETPTRCGGGGGGGDDPIAWCGKGEGDLEGPLEIGLCCHKIVEGGFEGSSNGLGGCRGTGLA